jgi:hypothetical protein
VGRQKFVELDSSFLKFCGDGYISLCVFRIPVCDRNYMTCSRALYYGQIDVAIELLKHSFQNQNLNQFFA